MKFRSLPILVILLFLTACSIPSVPNFPPAQPAVRSVTLAAELPTVTPTAVQPEPSSTPTIVSAARQSTPTTAVTPTPPAITAANSDRLRPVAIYPLFRRGLLHQVLWTPDGSSLVVETSLGLQILSVPDLQKRFSLPDMRALYFVQNGDLLVQDDGGLARLDPVTGNTRRLDFQPAENNGKTVPFVLSPNGRTWVTAAGSRSLQVQTLTGEKIATVALSSKTNIAFQVDGLFFSTLGSRLFAHLTRIDGETELAAVDTTTWTQIYETFNADSSPIFSSSDQQMLYARGDRVYVDEIKDGANWNNLALRTVKKISNDQQNVLSAQAYSFTTDADRIGVLYNAELSDSRALETKYLPSVLMIYNTRSALAERYINDLPPRITAFAYSPDGSQFFTTAHDGVLRLHDSQNGALIGATEPFDIDPAPALSTDGGMVAYALEDHIELVDPTTSKVTASLGDYPGATRLQARFMGEGDVAILVETPWRKFIDSYNILTRKFLFRYSDLSGCDFNRTGSMMTCFDGVRKFFDMPNGNVMLDIIPQGQQFFAMSESGTRIASCTVGSEFIFIWEASLGSIPKYTLIGTPDICGRLAFTPDGLGLVSASGYFWDISSGKIRATFKPAADSQLATVSADGQLFLAYPELIDLTTGRSTGELQTVPDIQAAYFQPDGVTLVLQTRRGLEFWAVSP